MPEGMYPVDSGVARPRDPRGAPLPTAGRPCPTPGEPRGSPRGGRWDATPTHPTGQQWTAVAGSSAPDAHVSARRSPPLVHRAVYLFNAEVCSLSSRPTGLRSATRRAFILRGLTVAEIYPSVTNRRLRCRPTQTELLELFAPT
jgi:hypothetical protein